MKVLMGLLIGLAGFLVVLASFIGLPHTPERQIVMLVVGAIMEVSGFVAAMWRS